MDETVKTWLQEIFESDHLVKIPHNFMLDSFITTIKVINPLLLIPIDEILHNLTMYNKHAVFELLSEYLIIEGNKSDNMIIFEIFPPLDPDATENDIISSIESKLQSFHYLEDRYSVSVLSKTRILMCSTLFKNFLIRILKNQPVRIHGTENYFIQERGVDTNVGLFIANSRRELLNDLLGSYFIGYYIIKGVELDDSNVNNVKFLLLIGYTTIAGNNNLGSKVIKVT